MASPRSAWTSADCEMVGARLKRTRIQQGLSIRQLADAAEVSKTTVVQAEAGRSTRRSTYVKLATVLGLHLDRLTQPVTGDALPFAVHRAGDSAWFDMANFDGGRLPPAAQTSAEERAKLPGVTPLNILVSRLEKGRVKPTILELTGESPLRTHAGEEFVYVLAGSALVTVGGHSVRLDKEESITFWSAEPHAYAPAPDSPLPVVLLSVRVDA